MGWHVRQDRRPRPRANPRGRLRRAVRDRSRPSSSRARSSATARPPRRAPTRCTASPSGRRKTSRCARPSAGPRARPSSCPRPCATALRRPRHGAVRRALAWRMFTRPVWRDDHPEAAETLPRPVRPRGPRRPARPVPRRAPAAKTDATRSLAGACSSAWRPLCPPSWAATPTSAARPRPCSRTLPRCSPGPSRAATSASASASTPWAPSPTASRSRDVRAVHGHLPHLQRLHAPGHPPRGAVAPARWCTCSRTTRSSSAKTAPRTSPSST
jgi:hypothetical protein